VDSIFVIAALRSIGAIGQAPDTSGGNMQTSDSHGDSLLILREFEWTTGDYILDEKKLIKFLTLIDDFDKCDDLVPHIKDFRKLPEEDFMKLPDIDQTVSSASLSEQSLQFFADIDRLSRVNPITALKLVMVLCCHENIYHTRPFIAKLSISLERLFITQLKSAIHRYFFLDSIPLETRLKFCQICSRNWPVSHYDYGKDKFFSDILPDLFIRYDKEEPQKALSLFEMTFPYDGYFISFIEDRSDFLRFISNHIEEHPKEYLQALCEYFVHIHCDVHSREYPEESVRKNSRTLYEATNDPKFADVLSANDNDLLKQACVVLLKKSYPDESWYPGLACRLWEIVADDPVIDKALLDYFCIVAVNAPDDFTRMDAICEKYREWVIRYKDFPSNEFGQYECHAKDSLNLINYSLCEHPMFRNCHITVADISKANGRFMDAIIRAYWEMVEWLLKNNLPACFYALKVAIRNNHYTCEETDKLAVEAEKKFLEHLEEMIGNYPDEAAHLVGSIIGDSQYSNYRDYLFPFLNRLIPVIIQLNPEIARASVQVGLNYTSWPRWGRWRPRDLRSNPVYQGIIEPKTTYF
jgi:hypothetical protein